MNYGKFKQKILLVIGHPKSDSFCHALADSFIHGAKENNNEIKIIDLYKEKFDPVYDLEEDAADVIKYQEMVTESDIITFVYPTWWFRAPAIIEGWIDRVMTTPYAYTFKKFKITETEIVERFVGNFGRPIGKLTDKKAIIIQTYGSPQFATRLWFFNLPIRRIKRGCFNVLGFKKTKFYPFFQVPFVEKNKRLKMLNKVFKIGAKL